MLWKGGAALLLTVGVLVLGGESPAAACVCVAHRDARLPLEFQGRAVAEVGTGTTGPIWRFEIVEPLAGASAGELVDVDIAASNSSCSRPVHPTAGGLYWVGAYRGSLGDVDRYFANLCGGYVDGHRPSAALGDVAPEIRGDSSDGIGMATRALGVGVVLVGIAGLIVWRARSSGSVLEQSGNVEKGISDP